MSQLKNEKFKEIYSINDIKSQDILFYELKEIIFGKDILKNISKIHRNSALGK